MNHEKMPMLGLYYRMSSITHEQIPMVGLYFHNVLKLSNMEYARGRKALLMGFYIFSLGLKIGEEARRGFHISHASSRERGSTVYMQATPPQPTQK